MKSNDRIFLFTVALMALVFSLLSLGNARDHFINRGARAVEPGVAGQARDIDVDQIERMIRQGYLSDHEAQFYTSVPPQLPPHSLPEAVP